ncbi:MAG TPA: single-stranded DNA-binding protein [Armatimonadetes bacterium]|nr:single-stranded DNA-binding protein [Armatimonadota bacterium]
MALNRVVLIGRLTRDPELKYTPSGLPVANFTLAVDRNQAPNAQGEKETDFIPCVAWRQQAEFAANYLGKGRLVAVEGRIQVRKWQTQDGQTRWSTEVICDRVQGLDRPRQDGEGAPGGGGMPGGGFGGPDAMDVDDPFSEP